MKDMHQYRKRRLLIFVILTGALLLVSMCTDKKEIKEEQFIPGLGNYADLYLLGKGAGKSTYYL